MGCAGFRVDAPADGDFGGIGSWEHPATKPRWRPSSIRRLPPPPTAGPQKPGCPVPGLGALGLCPASDLQPAVQLTNQLGLTKDGDYFVLLDGLGIPAQMAVHRCTVVVGGGHERSKA